METRKKAHPHSVPTPHSSLEFEYNFIQTRCSALASDSKALSKRSLLRAALLLVKGFLDTGAWGKRSLMTKVLLLWEVESPQLPTLHQRSTVVQESRYPLLLCLIKNPAMTRRIEKTGGLHLKPIPWSPVPAIYASWLTR